MIIETNGPEETFALGQKLGEQAKAGQSLPRESPEDLESQKRSAVRHLPSYRYTKRDGFRSIISTYTVSEISKRWKRSVMMTISLEMVCA